MFAVVVICLSACIATANKSGTPEKAAIFSFSRANDGTYQTFIEVGDGTLVKAPGRYGFAGDPVYVLVGCTDNALAVGIDPDEWK